MNELPLGVAVVVMLFARPRRSSRVVGGSSAPTAAGRGALLVKASLLAGRRLHGSLVVVGVFARLSSDR